MRLGVVLQAPWLRDAARLEELGFDVAWITEAEAPAPVVAAAALAPVTRGLRIAACVRAGAHPVALAEEAAIADLVLGGRLVLALEGDEPSLLTETFEILQLAFAARAFTYEGAHWRIPARLPEHEGIPARLRVTPAPAQLDLPVWLAGPAAPQAAATCLTTFLAETGIAAATEAWSALERLGGVGVRRLRRALRLAVAVGEQGELDVSELVGELRAHRDAWELDLAILALPTTLGWAARERALETIARFVRPRLQLDALPAGLEHSWNIETEEAVP